MNSRTRFVELVDELVVVVPVEQVCELGECISNNYQKYTKLHCQSYHSGEYLLERIINAIKSCWL
jgi:hypothetical protein